MISIILTSIILIYCIRRESIAISKLKKELKKYE